MANLARYALALLACIACGPALAQVNYVQTSIVQQNCSGTVVTGGTAVTPIAAQQAQHGFAIYNLDTTEPLWISLTGTAAAAAIGSFPLGANTATTFVDSNGVFITPRGFGTGNAVSVVAATAGHKFTCFYW